jgi:DNA-binding winged helix-turn-helix (wHTH) protein
MLLYLIRNFKSLTKTNDKHIFAFIDLTIESEENNIFGMAASFISQMYSQDFDTELNALLRSTLANNVNVQVFGELLYKLCHQYKYRITLVINNFGEILFPELDTKLKDYFIFLRHVYPQSINSLVIINDEIIQTDYIKLGELSEKISLNQYFAKDVIYDEQCYVFTVRFYTSKFKKTLNQQIIDNIYQFSKHDPTVIKYILEGIFGGAIPINVFESKDVKYIYENIGKERLNSRYLEIWNSLQKDSQNFLIGKSSQCTDFLKNTLLYSKDFMNPLFEYFIKTEVLTTINKSNSNIRRFLNAKEVIIFNLLEQNINKEIQRDEIAKAIWGENWTEKYSDWALNKTISRLRFKMKQNELKLEIKTAKKSGFMLTKLD